MPGGTLSSGTNLKLFLTRLMHNLYTEKEKTKSIKADTGDDDDDDDDGNQVGIGKIRGSVANKAGLNPYTEDPKEANDCDGNIGSNSSIINDYVDCGDTRGNDVSNENETNKRDGNEDQDGEGEKHDEPTVPGIFFPLTLLVVLTKEVISDNCDTLLNHTIDRGAVNASNLVAVPSRAEYRASAMMGQPTIVSLLSGMSSPANLASSIDRLKAKASYNEAYKEANQLKNKLGVKRLRIYEEEIEIKRFKSRPGKTRS